MTAVGRTISKVGVFRRKKRAHMQDESFAEHKRCKHDSDLAHSTLKRWACWLRRAPRKARLSDRPDIAACNDRSNNRYGGEGCRLFGCGREHSRKLLQARPGSRPVHSVRYQSAIVRRRRCRWVGWQTEGRLYGDNRFARACCFLERFRRNSRHEVQTRSRRYAPLSPNFQTGIPIRLALSARLS